MTKASTEPAIGLNDHVARLHEVRSHLFDVPGISLRELDEVADRLRSNRMVVALFGAFSAGKSSVLNAMLGDTLLAVSPNPTTAAVTEVQMDAEHVSEVKVTAKTTEELWSDVYSALDALHIRADGLADGISRSRALEAKDYPTSLRRQIRFLRAIADGYETMKERLGQTWDATPEDLHQFSADERYAAYVARVDVSTSNPMLEHGFVFVDTPGVDSIHRRHTDVAFRYMRHADAIIFVTYYTHAFTQGDRDFLLQLSGVQDVEETNKLFTVINAVDLAKSPEEREEVRARVELELKRLGLRQPRVYEVSAQLALAARQLEKNPADPRAIEIVQHRLSNDANGDARLVNVDVDDLMQRSGLARLESDLSSFVTNASSSLADDLVRRTISRLRDDVAAKLRAERLRTEANADERAGYVRALEDLIAKWAPECVSNRGEAIGHDVKKSLEELIFHAGERLRLRYRDLFRSAYHPGRFRVGRPADKLREAGEALADTIARQIDIEIRTFALRAEASVRRVLAVELDKCNQQLSEVGVGGIEERIVAEAPNIVPEEVHTVLPADLMSPYQRHFSSTKQFFEGDGAQRMMSESESAVLNVARERMAASATNVLDAAVQVAVSQFSSLYETAYRRLTMEKDRMDGEVEVSDVTQLADAKTYLDGLLNA